MRGESKILQAHLSRQAYVYVRQSSPGQVLSHPESARRQRELVQLATGLGWSPSRIEVLEGDQAKSGQVTAGREAFKRILGEVCVGEVGLLVGLEVARLARNNADWFPLIEMCGLTGTLIADEAGVYDPNDANDRLLLGLKGTLSEAELHMMRARLQGARWSLARRGELRRRIPGGYVWDERCRVVFDPDERVRVAVETFFRRFEQVGSACGVARSYHEERMEFPRRVFRGRWDGPLHWDVLTVRLANRVLHNPFYAGVYFYGRQQSLTTLDAETKARKTVKRDLPFESWEVLIHDAHPAYIGWEVFLRNQKRLEENHSVKVTGVGSARSGGALLQGIVHCGRCGRRMHVRYAGRCSYPTYVCASRESTGESTYCQGVGATRVDGWVEGRILEAIEPVGIEAALQAVEELERRSDDLRRQWELRIERADYEVGLARRRYEAVDPDNRLVAANLERDWEEKLEESERLRNEYDERAGRPPIRITASDRRRLQELAQDVPRLWHAKSTKSSDRKKIVRILVRDVWLMQEDEPRRTRIQIHWQTGAVTEGTVERPLPPGLKFKTADEVVERLEELYRQSQNCREIAEQLNQEGKKTGRGNAFTALRVRSLVYAHNFHRVQGQPQGSAGSADAGSGHRKESDS